MRVGHVVTRHRTCDACGVEWQTEERVTHVAQTVTGNTGTRRGPPVPAEPAPSISISDPDPEEDPDPDYCAEPELSLEPVVMTFPTSGKAKSWNLYPSHLAKFEAAFPGMDVNASFRRAQLWCENNPAKRKTAKGMGRFLQNWLEGDQNKGILRPKAHAPAQQSTPPTFAQIKAMQNGGGK